MSNGDESIELLARGLDQAGDVIAGVRAEQAGLPTPCKSWDVRELVNHVVHDVRQFAVMAQGGRFEMHDEDIIGDDWVGIYREAAEGLLEVWRRPGALDRMVKLGVGEVPARWQVGQQIANMAMHGWDIAKATGQSTALDPEVGRVALEWVRQNLKPEFRGDEGSGRAFGPEVPVDEDAAVYDKLAAFSGRDPG
jgi:uncharacterized protein (TIGR03086 family)